MTMQVHHDEYLTAGDRLHEQITDLAHVAHDLREAATAARDRAECALAAAREHPVVLGSLLVLAFVTGVVYIVDVIVLNGLIRELITMAFGGGGLPLVLLAAASIVGIEASLASWYRDVRLRVRHGVSGRAELLGATALVLCVAGAVTTGAISMATSGALPPTLAPAFGIALVLLAVASHGALIAAPPVHLIELVHQGADRFLAWRAERKAERLAAERRRTLRVLRQSFGRWTRLHERYQHATSAVHAPQHRPPAFDEITLQVLEEVLGRAAVEFDDGRDADEGDADASAGAGVRPPAGDDDSSAAVDQGAADASHITAGDGDPAADPGPTAMRRTAEAVVRDLDSGLSAGSAQPPAGVEHDTRNERQ